MSSEKLKKYKVYIEWKTEVKAKNHKQAKEKGRENLDKDVLSLLVKEIKDDK